MRGWLALVGVVLGSGIAHAKPGPVTVFLDRGGRVVSDDVTIPKFGGGDRAWNGIVSCVRHHYSPFQIDVVDRRPARGEFITAVIGGRASQLGLDDGSTNGVGPHSGKVIRNAIVFVFSRVGTGERDVANLCSVTAHEVAHALGLDHTYKCGDIMSYFLDRCGKRQFLDFDSPCGEDRKRACASGAKTQNSYRRLGALVGFRADAEPPEPTHDDGPVTDPWDGYSDDDDEPRQDSWPDADDDVDIEPDREPIDPYTDDEEPAPRVQRRGGYRRVYIYRGY